MAFFVLTEKGKLPMLVGGIGDDEVLSNVLDARSHGHPTERYVPAALFFEIALGEPEAIQPPAEESKDVGRAATDAA